MRGYSKRPGWAKEGRMALVNLTPHPIVVRTDGGDVTIPPSGQVARVTSQQTLAGYIDLDGVQIPVQRTTFGQVECLPAPAPDTVYIVSGLVLSALAGTRPDVVQPDTSPAGAIRDGDGRIVAVRGFQI